MGARKILILFFSTMTVSLVILIVLFNLVFKNLNMDFETKTPESAPTIQVEQSEETEEPDLSEIYDTSADFQTKGVNQSKVKVPGHVVAPSPEELKQEKLKQKELEEQAEKESLKEAEKQAKQNSPSAPKVVNSSGNRSKAPTVTLKKKKLPEAPTPDRQALYQVYMDGFSSEADARAKVDRLKASGVDAFVNTSGRQPIVKLGTFSSPEGAQALASQHGAKVKKVN